MVERDGGISIVLTRGSVPPGVGSVSYSVSLGFLCSRLVSAPSVRQIMQARL